MHQSADNIYLCLFSLFLVLNKIYKIIAYNQINIIYDWIVINNSSETELNTFINEA